MEKEDIKKKKALSEDELLNVSGGMRPVTGDNGACPNITDDRMLTRLPCAAKASAKVMTWVSAPP